MVRSLKQVFARPTLVSTARRRYTEGGGVLSAVRAYSDGKHTTLSNFQLNARIRLSHGENGNGVVLRLFVYAESNKVVRCVANGTRRLWQPGGSRACACLLTSWSAVCRIKNVVSR